MSVLLVTPPTGSGANRDGREPFEVDWVDTALRWIDEWMGELEAGDPRIDVVRLGQFPREKSVAWCEVYAIDVRPDIRHQDSDPADGASLSLAVTCFVGQELMRTSPYAAMRVGTRVRKHLDEWARTGAARDDLGRAVEMTVFLDRARLAELQVPSRDMRAPAVFVDAGRIELGADRSGDGLAGA